MSHDDEYPEIMIPQMWAREYNPRVMWLGHIFIPRDGDFPCCQEYNMIAPRSYVP